MDEASRMNYALGTSSAATSPHRDQVRGAAEGTPGRQQGRPAALKPEEMQAALGGLEKRVNEQRAKQQAESAQKAAAAGSPISHRTPSRPASRPPERLPVQVLKPGTGRTPGPTTPSPCTTAARWWTESSSTARYDRGQPASFPVSGVIAGWTEALQLMKEGAKYQSRSRPNLAYGDRVRSRDRCCCSTWSCSRSRPAGRPSKRQAGPRADARGQWPDDRLRAARRPRRAAAAARHGPSAWPSALWPDEFVQALTARPARPHLRQPRLRRLDALRGACRAECAARHRRALLRRPVAAPYRLEDMAADTVGCSMRSASSACTSSRLDGRHDRAGGRCAAPERVLSLTSIMSNSGNPSARSRSGAGRRCAPSSAGRRGPTITRRWSSISCGCSASSAAPPTGTSCRPMRPVFERVARRGLYRNGTARQLARDPRHRDRRPMLQKITTPTLVLHGADDPLVPLAAGHDTAANIAVRETRGRRGHGPRLPCHAAREARAADRGALPRGTARRTGRARRARVGARGACRGGYAVASGSAARTDGLTQPLCAAPPRCR